MEEIKSTAGPMRSTKALLRRISNLLVTTGLLILLGSIASRTTKLTTLQLDPIAFDLGLVAGMACIVGGISIAVGMYLQEEKRRSIKITGRPLAGRDINEMADQSDKLKQEGLIPFTMDDQQNESSTEPSVQKNGLTPDVEILQYKMELLTVGLEEEVELTRKSARLNMWVGVTTTGIAVSVLLYTLLSTGADIKQSGHSEILFFAPRVSLAFLVEMFSFFFLKLYRRNLDNVKYLTNELTNVKFKIISLESAISKGSAKCIDDIFKELIKTERNFILKKGETTVELEKYKIESKEEFIPVEAAKILTKQTTGNHTGIE